MFHTVAINRNMQRVLSRFHRDTLGSRTIASGGPATSTPAPMINLERLHHLRILLELIGIISASNSFKHPATEVSLLSLLYLQQLIVVVTLNITSISFIVED